MISRTSLKDMVAVVPGPFDGQSTFDSGQCFRWFPLDGSFESWLGTVGSNVLKVEGNQASIIAKLPGRGAVVENELECLVERYFSAGDIVPQIITSFPKDPFLDSSVTKYPGLRILTQDPWECLVSFVCSINKNIPAIKTIIRNLSLRFGKPIIPGFDGRFHTFPEPLALSLATKKQFMECGVGFRWKYIKFIASKVANGELDLGILRKVTYEEAISLLVSKISGKTFGVGPKVADCVLLYSAHKLEAFPVDVWILRCLEKNYSDLLGHSALRISSSNYFRIGALMRKYFGKYAGYCQQYLYTESRKNLYLL